MTLAPKRMLLALLLLGSSVAAVPAPPKSPTPAPEALPPVTAPLEFFPVDEIRPGMIGIARTVFEGDRLEEFQVEFLGVLRNAIGPRQDMIIARLKGEKVEFTGVVSGMSGSPVYVEGRLVGAVSYRLGAFAKEPIAGITPIGDMVKLVDPATPTTKSASSTRASAPASDLLSWLVRGADRGSLPENAVATGAVVAAGMPGMQPIATPLVCSGCDAGVLRYYAPAFEVMGLVPTSGGGALSIAEAGATVIGADTAAAGATARSLAPPRSLLPGTAIGASLATGDVNLSGVGTLTHVDGGKVFAFGHPMLGVGSLQVPMTQADVILTFASSAASFKVANTTAPIGTIIEDRLTAIVGEVGRVAPTLPWTVRVQAGGARRDFHYNVVRERAWAPLIVALTTANSLMRTTEYDSASTLSLDLRLVVDGLPEVRYRELYSGINPSQPVHALVANDAGGVLGLIANNPFQETALLSAEADIEVLDSARVASLTSLSVSRSEVRRGEPFLVRAGLTPFRGATRTVSFDVTLPEDTPSGELQVIVGGGSAIDGLDRRVQERQLTQAGNLRDLMRLISRQRRSDALYLRVARRAPSAIVRSEFMPDLPLSIFNVFNNPRLSADSTLIAEAPVLEESKDLDLVVVGGRRLTLKVK